MISTRNIHSLSDFQRKTREHIERLKRTGEPEVLTVNGRAEIVVQDAEAYQCLLDRLDRAEAIIGIREGLDSIERGEPTFTIEEVMRSLQRVDDEHEVG